MQLFGYLAADKRSVLLGDTATPEVIAGADLVVTDLTGDWSLDDVRVRAGLSTVIVAITPFGTIGPIRRPAGRRQRVHSSGAVRDSIASRGWPGSEPLQAGGRDR